MKQAIGLIGIILVICGLSGCSNYEPPKPFVDIEPNCMTWTICTSPQKNVYNITGADCIKGLQPEQAQKVFDIFITNGIKVGYFSCEAVNVAEHQLQIQQTN